LIEECVEMSNEEIFSIMKRKYKCVLLKKSNRRGRGSERREGEEKLI